LSWLGVPPVKLTAAQRAALARSVVAWGLLAVCVLIPVGIAATNPLQASRDALWIAGGMAGVLALALLLLQPLLAAGALPGPTVPTARRWHRWLGATVVALTGLHIVGLYLSSPEDIADALLLVAPTPFSVYGVIGLGGVVLTAALVAFRSRLGLRHASWRMLHNGLALIVVMSSIAHALLIEGAMGTVSKAVLCGLVLSVTVAVLVRVHVRRGVLER
jgi:predicted ferric reductase